MTRACPPSSGQAGISLLEVIVSVTILGVAGGFLLMNSRTSATGNERSKVYAEASTATKEVLETIRLLPLDSLSRLQDRVMEHSQGTGVLVRATVRGVLPPDVDGFAGLDTSTLRHLTLRTSYRNVAGSMVGRTFSTILYKP